MKTRVEAVTRMTLIAARNGLVNLSGKPRSASLLMVPPSLRGKVATLVRLYWAVLCTSLVDDYHRICIDMCQ